MDTQRLGGDIICNRHTTIGGDIICNGKIDCNEIQVNSIPLNSFYNFTFGYNYWGTFGNGIHIYLNPDTSYNESYSHFKTFDRTNEKFNCKAQYLGTYEITCHVTYRNMSNSRHNPCIAIGKNNDVCKGDVSDTNTGPNWTVALPNSYSQHNIFSVQYVRYDSEGGKVTILSCSRIYHLLIQQIK
jgi:hypothetical protein